MFDSLVKSVQWLMDSSGLESVTPTYDADADPRRHSDPYMLEAGDTKIIRMHN